MSEIKLTVEGEVYTGRPLMVADWLRAAEYTETYADTNVLANAEAGLVAMRMVADYLGVDAERMQQHCTLAEIMGVWHAYNQRMADAFAGGTQGDPPKKKTATGGHSK